jgi:hypothetical protein
MKHKQAAYNSLTQVIDQMVADRLDRGTIESLRNMLELDAFQPIRSVIENKIIEIGNFLKSKETPSVPPIEVWMGNVPKVQIESNEEETWLPFEYENEGDVREVFNQVKGLYPDLEFDIVLPPNPLVDGHA